MFKYPPTATNDLYGGTQHLFIFPNGQGASVIKHSFSYGHAHGNWELAVIKGNAEDFFLDYSTPITEEVLGNLTVPEVDTLLTRIKSLPPVEKAR